MEIPDLRPFPKDHPPSPFPSPVVVGRRGERIVLGQLAEGLALLPVGWLGARVLVTGRVPAECIERLVEAYETKKMVSDGTMGWHDCEVCTTQDQRYPDDRVGPIVRWRGRELRLYGHGHHLVRLASTVYMCPVLVLHYMLDHEYQPPAEFLKAVVEGTFLTTTDLVRREESLNEWMAGE